MKVKEYLREIIVDRVAAMSSVVAGGLTHEQRANAYWMVRGRVEDELARWRKNR